jgi:tRNA (pseudouridine54-N1)-methyltransferase
MRRFVIVGHRAITSGDFKLDDLCGSAGRLDVLLRTINSSFFLSHDIRRDVELNLVLLGEPTPPKTIRMVGSELKYLNPDERSTGALVRNALMKAVNGEERSSPGIYISNRNYKDVLSTIPKTTQFIYLKEDGADIRDVELGEDVTFVLSDDRDLTDEEEDLLMDHDPVKVCLGPISYHSDHCVLIANNEMDRQGI